MAQMEASDWLKKLHSRLGEKGVGGVAKKARENGSALIGGKTESAYKGRRDWDKITIIKLLLNYWNVQAVACTMMAFF